jgi:indolepyruvate ferredoxin oxidoreductase alpha subunit
LTEVAKLTIASNAPGRSIFLLGNEAIARGAIEAGVRLVAAYPGTPSSEITEALIDVAKELDVYIEWSVNEKIAFEAALGASMCGVRAMAVMKHVGVNVAQDPLMSATYMGAIGGLVLVVADDPGQWSSQNEQDSRYIAEMGYIPVLEPSSSQEAKDMMVDAFRLSEQFGQIFMLRSVTRIGHARSDIKLGGISKEKREGVFKKDPRLVCLPAFMRKNRILLVERFAKIKEATNSLSYNQLKLVNGAKLGIIACGISYSYALEALRWLGLENKVSLLKIGTPQPLPENLVKQLISSVPEVLVIEELEPFVENHVKVIAQENSINVKIHGKDVVPLRLELSIRKATEAITKLTGDRLPVDFARIDKLAEEIAPLLPYRPPTLCAGCPHRAAFYAINVAARKVKKDLGERVYTGDIGCYSLATYPPLYSDDTAVCMGSGFGVANGMAHVINNPVIGHLGDSTFFHSGIPPMINAVFNNARITMVVLDNSATAMTGFQPHPGTGLTARGEESLKLKPEEIARACGVKFVEVVDPFDVKKTIEIMEKAIRFEGPSLVVSRRLCNILEQRVKRRRGEKIIPYHVEQEKCSDCQFCVKSLGCPAIIIEDDKIVIDASQCAGCGVCAQICPKDAIIQDEGE